MEWDLSLCINVVDYGKAFDILDSLDASTTLRNIREVYLLKLVRRDGLQGYGCRTTHILFHGEDRTEAEVPSVTFVLLAGHRLDNEEDHRI